MGSEEEDKGYKSMWKLEQQEAKKVNQLVHDSEFWSVSRASE